MSLNRTIGLGLGLDFFLHPNHGEVCDDDGDCFDVPQEDEPFIPDELEVRAIAERFAVTFVAIVVL